MSGVLRRVACPALWLALAFAGAGTVEVVGQPASGSETSSSARDLLDRVREDLVQLRFEKALAAIEALLGRPDLTEAERGEALVLRAQAHIAFGDLGAAERDFRDILRLRPAYRPDASLTPKKAMQRFEKIRAELVGHVRVRLTPADARLLVDGRETTADPEGRVALLAGEHRVRAERDGHDPHEELIAVVPDAEVPLTIELVPNARSVLLRTVPAGVAVKLDGVAVGVTGARDGATEAGELLLENLPLGEHVFELSKECFREERVRDTLTVDLLDRAPKRYRPVVLKPARASVSLRGGPSGGQVILDGAPVATLPLGGPVATCPGQREIAVRVGERVVWSERHDLRDGEDAALQVRPRPNIVLVGSQSWPAALTSFAAAFNDAARLGPAIDESLSDAAGWTRLALPPATDLALAVLPSGRQGMADRWFLYSPILRRVVPVETPPDDRARPTWTVVNWGFRAVDSRVGGRSRVVEVSETGAAARAGVRRGDRILAVGGREVTSVAELRATLAAATPDRPIKLRIEAVTDGAVRDVDLVGSVGPRLVSDPPTPLDAMVRAAWAVVDSVAIPERKSEALANLALLFSAHGQHDLAAETWRRVDWPERAGIGAGTRDYYLGQALEALGREDAAIEAYRRAATSTATAFHDDGPEVAPAALDRLADLGIVPAAPAADVSAR